MNKKHTKSKYETHVKSQFENIIKWAEDGLTDEQIASNLNISKTTLYKYKKQHTELNELLKKGKKKADFEVENALFKKAIGYTYEEVTKEEVENPETGKKELKVVKVVTKHVAPDVGAIIFWLKNRKSKDWKDNPHKVKFDKEILELRKKDMDMKGW